MAAGCVRTGKLALALQECGVSIDELLRIDIFDSDAAHDFGICGRRGGQGTVRRWLAVIVEMCKIEVC